MIDLFHIEGHKLTPTPAALCVSEFKAIWDRDKSKKKEKALAELRYIYLLVHPKSPFMNYSEDLRHKKVKENVFGKKRWRPDGEVQAAIDFYEEQRSTALPTYQLWRATVEASKSLGDYLKEVDFNERDEKGRLVNNIAQVTNAMQKAGELANSMKTLYDKVMREQYETASTRANREINHFEQ